MFFLGIELDFTTGQPIFLIFVLYKKYVIRIYPNVTGVYRANKKGLLWDRLLGIQTETVCLNIL